MKKIILVEDDADIREVVSLALDPAEYRVIGYDAGNYILQNEVEAPDLFVLDKNISGTNGLAVCRFIKDSERYRHVPVLMLSASPDIAQLAAEAGADGFIAKPFSLKTLRDMVSRYA